MTFNWLVDTVNLNSGIPFTLADVSANSNELTFGIILVGFALIHNIAYKIMTIIQANTPSNFKQEITGSDRSLFQKFIETFPSNGMSIELLKNHNFGASFHENSLKEIEKFIQEWDNAEHTFLNEAIEQHRIILHESCSNFIIELNKQIGYIGTSDRLDITPDAYRGAFNTPQYILDNIKEVNLVGTACFKAHQEFILYCRQQLAC